MRTVQTPRCSLFENVRSSQFETAGAASSKPPRLIVRDRRLLTVRDRPGLTARDRYNHSRAGHYETVSTYKSARGVTPREVFIRKSHKVSHSTGGVSSSLFETGRCSSSRPRVLTVRGRRGFLFETNRRSLCETFRCSQFEPTMGQGLHPAVPP